VPHVPSRAHRAESRVRERAAGLQPSGFLQRHVFFDAVDVATAKRSFAEQLADEFQIVDAIAYRLHYPEHGHGQEHSDDPPYSGPEEQADEDRDLVHARRPADQPGTAT
jgi:hypothetical protein